MQDTQPKNKETSTATTEVFSQYELPPIPPAQGALANVGGNTIVSSGNLQSPNYSPNGSSGFVMQPNGDAVFNNLTATGRITFTDGGVIGGFEFGDDYVRDTGDSFGLASTVTGGDDIRFWSGSTFANRATAPFRLTESGFFYGSNVDVTGTVTSNAGAIAGWTLAVGEISSTNNKIKLQSTNERILVGNATAPLTGTGVFIGKDGTDYEFRVGDPTGKYIHFDGVTGFTMNGMYISQAVLASIAAGSELSIQNWQFDGVFSATSGSVVAWTGGTFRFANETTTYTISAGNTSTMAALTYIYFDVAFPTVLKITTSATTAIGTGKILVCTAKNQTTGLATFQAYGGSGGIQVGNTQVDTSLNNWSITNTFSVATNSTPQQVNWGAGSLRIGETTYSISAGNTGTMSARTYIYFEPLVSTTVLQVTTTFATAIGNGKILIGSATASATTIATYTILGGISAARWGVASSNLSTQDWNITNTFAATASNVVTWTSGFLVTSDYTTYSIAAGDTSTALTAAGKTSPMASTTYLYLNPAVSATVLQATDNFVDALGDGKLLVAGAKNNTGEAVFWVYKGRPGNTNIDGSSLVVGSVTTNEIAANTITASNIAAGTITTNEIAANTIVAGDIAAGTITTTEIAANTIVAGDIAAGTITTTQIAAGTILASNIAAGTITADRIAANSITANEIYGTTLSVIAADMGTITAGTITFTASGHIKGGQSAYNSGTGFFLGYESGAYKFSVGDPTNNKYFNWNGTDIDMAGSIKNLRFLVAGEDATITLPTPVYINTTSGKVLTCDDADAGKLAYTGMVLSSMTNNSNIGVQFSDVADGYSNLNIGSTYYLNKNAGTTNINTTLSNTGTITGNYTFGYAAGITSGVGQTFTTSTVYLKLYSIKLQLKKTGSPSDNVIVKLYASDKSTLLATFDAISGSTLTTSFADYTFLLPAYYTLSASTTYFFSVTRSGSLDTSNYYDLNVTANDYAGGELFTNSASWTAQLNDAYFVIGLLHPNASGNISPIAGVNSVKVGRAISTTKLLIYQLAI